MLRGIPEILASAKQRPDITQGLLTDNMRRGAQTKLGHFNLWHYFSFGAFAADSAIRNEPGPHALRRAAVHTGITFDPFDVWIIGDIPHDIACGTIIGARTLAVATGHHSHEELAAHFPDCLLDDLSDPAPFWRAIES
ncbi:MAG: HAD hydrolase-like protein [Candidatus Synoicihabitans palmerolidicus]|nr:HAD hydrolase-like protein [Candidatus Synoicihabitans palmerolidicus]